MQNDTQHENHDHRWMAEGVTASERAYRRGDHLVRQHSIDRWQEMPAGDQAQDRLHTRLHHEDLEPGDREGLEEALQAEESLPPAPVGGQLSTEKDILALVQDVGSQMEHGDPTYWPDQAMVLVNLIWSRLIHTDTPATLTSATAQAGRMFMDAADRLTAVDRRTAAELMAATMRELLSATEEFTAGHDD